MATGFWGGMAEGVDRGMRMRTLYDLAQERKKKVEEEDAIKKAGQAVGLQTAVTADQAARAGAAPGAQGLVPDAMTQGSGSGSQLLAATQGDALGDQAQAFPVAGPGGGTGNVGLALAAQQDGAIAKKKGGGLSEFADSSGRLTASFRKAIELGRYDIASNLMGLREQVNNQYRDEAFGRAMSAFEMGDMGGLVSFANNFSYTPIEFTGVEMAAQTQGGEPVYVVKGVNHETGEQMAQPFTKTAMMRYLNALADPKAYKEMYVLEAKRLADMEDFKEKERFKTDEGVRGAKAKRAAGIGGGGSGGRMPADVETAQWLLNQGVAQDSGEAWDMVRGARTKSRQDFALDMAKSILADQRSNGMLREEDRLSAEAAFQQGLELYDAMRGRAEEPAQQSSSLDVPADIAALMDKYGPKKEAQAPAPGRDRYIAPTPINEKDSGPGLLDRLKPFSPALQMLD